MCAAGKGSDAAQRLCFNIKYDDDKISVVAHLIHVLSVMWRR